MTECGKLLLFVEGQSEPIIVADGATWNASLHDVRLAMERGFFIVDAGNGIEMWPIARVRRIHWAPVDDDK